MKEQRSLWLVIRTPAEVVVECAVSSLTAEDSSGRFGVRPHAETLVAALVNGLLTYREPSDGNEHFVAVGEGLLHIHHGRAEVAVRRAIPCSSLEMVEVEVSRALTERTEGATSMYDAFRSLYHRALIALANEERQR
jgi:alternate F1F0 ATPase F1 subunit epsilon